MNPSHPGPKAWTLLLLLGVIFGSSFMFVNIAVREAPPMAVAVFRLLIAASLLTVFALATGAKLPPLRRAGARLWGLAAIAGLLGTLLPYWFVAWAQQHISSAQAGLLMAPMPIVSLLLSHFLIAGERMSFMRVGGFALGFLGVALLIGPDAFDPAEGSEMRLLAQLACLGTMLCYALNGIALKRAGAVNPLGMSAAVLLIAALAGLPLAIWADWSELGEIGLTTWTTIGVLGIFPTASAQMIMMWILALAGPPFLASVNYQVPLWATVFGVAFLGEALSPWFWAALLLILSGMALVQFGERAMRTKARPPE